MTFQSVRSNFQMVFTGETAEGGAGAAALREYADYLGRYDVTPMITSQRLETADKHMLDDVLIRTIPTRETENEAGGTTFVIGGV